MEKTEKNEKLSFNEKHDVVSWILMIGAFILLIVTVYVFYLFRSDVVILVGILVTFVVGGIGFINNQKNAKNNERISVLNEEFYINKEIKNYRQIGKDFKDKKEKYTHKLWQEDIKANLKQATANYEDELFRCLIRVYRDAQTSSDVSKAVVLPVEIGIFAIMCDKMNDKSQAMATVLVASIVMVIMATMEAYDNDRKMAFVKDTVEAIYGKEKLNDLELLI